MPLAISVIRTEGWAARPPAEVFDEKTPRFIVIHHTATPNPPDDTSHGTLDGARELARRIQADHMDNRGWADSGHNFLNTTGGFVVEGRHGSWSSIQRGRCVASAHAVGANDSPGIENEGTFTTHEMSTQQWESLVTLCAAICESAHLDPEAIRGHRDFNPTQCPGDWLYGQLPRLQEEVRQRLASEEGSPAVLTPEQSAFLGRVKAGAAASEALGVPASVVVAQAILESQWGQSGLAQKGNALFGIKARSSWQGAVYSGTTREWDGTGYRTYTGKERAYPSHAAAIADGCDPVTLFRAYSSLAESIQDHARLFTDNARYRPCLEQYRETRDPRAFATCIHQAGYATDPAYGQKLISLMERHVPDLVGGPPVFIDGRRVDPGAVRVVDDRVFIHVRVLESCGYTVVYRDGKVEARRA